MSIWILEPALWENNILANVDELHEEINATKQKIFQLSDCHFHAGELSQSEAQKVLDLIIEENAIKHHMLEPSVEELINTQHFIAAQVDELLIGYTRLTPIGYENIQEVWSSIVAQAFRRKHVGLKMMQELIDNSQKDPVYGITNVAHVEHMFDELWLMKISKENIHQEVLQKIEELWELLEDDVIYANKKFLELYIK